MLDPKVKILESLKSVAAKLKSELIEHDKHWTEGIKTALCNLGKDLGYEVCTSSIKSANYGEWLYDLCWLDMEKTTSKTPDWKIISIPLVVESEWQSELEIDSDFDKLIQSRAMLRLMIFQSPTPQASDIILKRLSSRINAFNASRSDDAYLVAIIDQSNLEFDFHGMNGLGDYWPIT